MGIPVVRLRHLNYHYPGDKTLAINDVNLDVFKNEWLVLVGRNGSGKSTLIKLIDGLLPKDHGRIEIDHHLLTLKTLFTIRSKIGVVFQNPKDQFVATTVKDEISFGLENWQCPPDQIKNRVKDALKLVGMSGYQNSLLTDLSGGQQQRIAIADVIALRPKIMILDECTSMLNPQGRYRILRLIDKLKFRLGLTVLDITHDVSETKYADRIAVMNCGRIILTGSPNEVFNRSQLLRKLHLALPAPDVLRDLLRRGHLKIPNRHFSEAGLLTWIQKLFSNV